MKKTNGITMISLTITIIILLIISGIAIYSGKETINKAKLEELRTNMLLIQAKAKEYVEEANFKIGISPEEGKKETVRNSVYLEKAQLTKASELQEVELPSGLEATECYVLTEDTLKEWGLDKIKLSNNEYYLVKFDEENEKVEVYNTDGYDGKYSLTEIDSLE